MILYVVNAKAEGFKNFPVISNNSEFVTYLSAYFDQLRTKNGEKIHVKYGLKERQRNIPIHSLSDILHSGKSRVLLKTRILNGGNFMSKVGSKYHSSTQNQINFCAIEEASEDDYASQQAGKYHMKFAESNLSAESFNHCLHQSLTVIHHPVQTYLDEGMPRPPCT